MPIRPNGINEITNHLEITNQDEYLNSKDIYNEFANRLLNSALHYARSGYPVFPLHNVLLRNGNLECSCHCWRGCKNQGKHPRTLNGLDDATTNENKIIDWWEKYPNANIGLITGIESGIIVLDIDVKYGGEYSLDELQDIYKSNLKANYEPLPATLTTVTGSRGRHLYFKYPLNFTIKGSASKVADGLDIRANGNYVVAPPSNHISGNNYEWLGVNIPISDAPRWLIYEILMTDKTNLGLDKFDTFKAPTNKFQEKIRKGHRQDYLFRYICGLVNSFPKEEVLKQAMAKNNDRLEPPFAEREVIYHVNYLYQKYGKRRNG